MPGKSIGAVYYDVLPDLGKFASGVTQGVGRLKPVKLLVEADTSKLAAQLTAATKTKPVRVGVEADTAKLSAGIKAATAAKPAKIVVDADVAKAQARIGELVGKTGKLSDSDRQLASAAGTARVATQRLAETQATAAEGSARLISSEESAARAARNLAAAQANIGKSSTESHAAVQKLGTGLLVAGAGIALALGKAESVTAGFDQAVSHVASTGADARANLSQLRVEAIKYGASTAYSATEAANAQEELIKANVSVTDTINGGLSGALNLAAAGSLGVADAAGIMGTALSQFNLKGADASHVSDLLSAAAGKAQGEVSDFAEALKYVGPIAHSSGVSIDETTGVLAEFANQGVLGSQAGTTLRGVLLGLTAPSKNGAKVMEQYGINVRDAAGNFVGLQAAAGELQNKLGGLSSAERDAALSRLFGRTSLVGATVLYNGGSAAVGRWTKAVNDSGYAARTAATKMDNLKGDVEKLGGSLQSAFIKGSESSQGPLRTLVQGITGITDALGGLSSGKSSALFIGAGLAGAAAIGAGGIIKLGGAVKEAKLAMEALSLTAKGASLAAGGIGLVLGVTAAIVGHFAVQSQKAKAVTDSFTQALIQSKGAIDGQVASVAAKQLQDSGAIDSANKLGISTRDLTQASLGNVDAQGRVNAALDAAKAKVGQASSGLDNLGNKYDSTSDDVKKVSSAIGDTSKSFGEGVSKAKQFADSYNAAKTSVSGVKASAEQAAKILGLQRVAAGSAADALGQLAGKGDVYKDKVSQLASAYVKTDKEQQTFLQGLFSEGDAFQAAESSHSGYEASIDSANKALGRHSLSVNKDTGYLNDNTDKQRKAEDALGGLATAGKEYVKGLAAQGAGAKTLSDATANVRAQFIKSAHASGLSAKAAGHLADQYGLVPKEVSTEFNAFGLAAAAVQVETFKKAILGLSQSQRIHLQTIIDTKGNKAGLAYLNSLTKPKTIPVGAKTDKSLDVVKRTVDKIGEPVTTRVHINPDGSITTTKTTIDKLGKPRTSVVTVKVNGAAPSAAAINHVSNAKRTALIYVNQKGQQLTQAQINKTKGKGVYIAVDQKGQPLTQAKINSTKGVARYVLVDQHGQPATQSKINSTKGKGVTITVTSSGVGATQKAIDYAARDRHATIRVSKTGSGNSGEHDAAGRRNGGPITRTYPAYAGGSGVIRGHGGPREDNVAGVDRATGLQTSWVSVGETVVNAMATRANGPILAAMNRGETFQRLAGGGTVGSTRTRSTGRGRPIVVNVDLGPELGGIRRIVVDELDQREEYAASIERMG